MAVLGINARNLEYIYPENPRQNFPNIDDKLRAKDLLAANGLPIPATYHVVTGPESLRGWAKRIPADVDAFVLKPSRGFGGQGIGFVRRDDEGWSMSDAPPGSLYVEMHIKRIMNGAYSIDNIADAAILEHKLSNVEAIMRLLPNDVSGVADLRTIVHRDRVVMAMLRLPTARSGGKANLHQGGLGIGIDIDTGRTTLGCWRNRIVEKHPESQQPLSGHVIPGFDSILEMSRQIPELVGLGYVGVDFVLDSRLGPVIIEVNARPGLAIQLANGRGLRQVLRDASH